jgi:hypothetical protein
MSMTKTMGKVRHWEMGCGAISRKAGSLRVSMGSSLEIGVRPIAHAGESLAQ